jgi:hypothetical protein
MKDYTMEFVIGDAIPISPLQKCMFDVTQLVREQLKFYFTEEHENIQEIPPQIFITMTITNILVNLLMGCIDRDNPIETRLKMVKDSLDEINSMTMKIWKSIEIEMTCANVAH